MVLKSTLMLGRFLNKLTEALHGMGVDLSQSRISVQIDLGKQNKVKLDIPETMKKVQTLKGFDSPRKFLQVPAHVFTYSQVDDLNPASQGKANSSSPCAREHSDQTAKRLKTSNHL